MTQMHWWRPAWVAALLGLALASGFAIRSATAKVGCMVTVVVTDENGNADPDVSTSERPCLPGQTNGGIDYYNPYNDTHRFVADIPLEPIPDTGSGGTTPTHGASASTGAGTASTGCTPVPRGAGTKTGKLVVLGPGQHPCPASSTTSSTK